ncbi:right-handed parallel beta-helix repeat-containing protein [Myxococcus stipitatus]|uniref:right-handed parallel beta-helix repeat-containing protein n=1 Tax=Myxococcus stipitatus TaxID=83455 RepID=UPI0030D54CD7
MRIFKGNFLKQKTPVAALATSLFMLGSAAHGASLPPIGVQPVPDTPVAALPDHADHAAIATPSDQPGVQAQPLAAAANKSFSREWVVSPSGNDGGDGSADRPLRTLNKAVSMAGPGEVIRVQGGTYAERVIIGANAKAGTPEAKITLQGEGGARIIPGPGTGGMVQVRRPHWVIDGFNIDVQRQPLFAVTFEGNVTGSTLVNSELRDGGGGAAVTTFNKATGAVIENNHIHGFVKNSGNKDSHGVVVQPTSKDITVRNNDIHDNSGDSVQCLGPEGFSSLPPADGLLVENNHFYGNRENAVDIKTCYGVVIRNNRMHQFRPTSTAKGDVVVVHYSASNVLVEDNEIYDGAKGISVGGNHTGPVPTGIVVRRNRVYNMSNNAGGEGTGIRLENSKGTVVVNNTVTSTKTALVVGHGTGGPTQAPVVRNNIIDGTVVVDLGGQAPGMKLDHNLIAPSGQFKRNGVVVSPEQFKASTGDSSSISGPPGLGDAFSPSADAVDKGVDVGLPFCGGAPDIGAVEVGC